MRIRILIFLLICCFISETFAGDTNGSYTLYLIRHAEKEQDGSRDPELTDIGVQRSEKLADWFVDKDIDDIWSSDYKRTRDTASPIVSKLGVELIMYDPRELSDLTEELKERRQTAVIVGHSNTTPELAGLLCDCEIEEMDEAEHSRLIVISIGNGETLVETLRQR